jgi:hypothetical protein
VTTWSIGEAATKSGAGEAERLELLKRHRQEVRRALASQRECLKLLDTKIGYYSSCLSEPAPQTTEL